MVSVLGGGAMPASAQTETAKQDIKKAGNHIKKAGKETGDAAKDTWNATKAEAKAAKRKLTRTVVATCKDGTTYSGKTRTGACAEHGGVKAWSKR
jgi:multidrug resistance efflux pump